MTIFYLKWQYQAGLKAGWQGTITINNVNDTIVQCSLIIYRMLSFVGVYANIVLTLCEFTLTQLVIFYIKKSTILIVKAAEEI